MTRVLRLVASCSVALTLASPPTPRQSHAGGQDKDGWAAEYPVIGGEHLQWGRTIWLGTCENCHGIGVAGAPIATNRNAWARRIRKGRETLYLHALEGFFGPLGTMMPERGGNEELTDDEVKAAVDYMLALSQREDEEKGTNQ